MDIAPDFRIFRTVSDHTVEVGFLPDPYAYFTRSLPDCKALPCKVLKIRRKDLSKLAKEKALHAQGFFVIIKV